MQCELHYVTLIIRYVALSLQCESAFRGVVAKLVPAKSLIQQELVISVAGTLRHVRHGRTW